MAREVRVAILGDSRDFSRAVSSARGDASKLDRAFSGIGDTAVRMSKAVAIGIGGLAVGGAALAKGFIDAAVESQKVTAQTEAVLKSMGDGANVTAKQVADLSTKLSMQSGIDDELIQSGSNVLLTFGKLRNGTAKTDKVFDRATKAALDMSVALGTDMSSASMMVGKALNDPIRGLTALRRSGIQFTASQEKQIKAMVEAGDVMGAQKIMLSELERQFGGSAAAQATAGDKLKVVWGNLQEQLGERLLPVFNRVADWLSSNLPHAIDVATPYVEAVIGAISRFATEAGPAIKDFVQDKLQALANWWDEHGPKITAAVKGFAEDFDKWVLAPMAVVAAFVVEELVPKIATFVTWIAENEGALKAFGTLIGVTLVGHYVKLGVEATVSAAKQVAAWVSTKTAAIASAAETAAIVALYIAGWVAMAAQAVVKAAIIVASWVATSFAAGEAAAAQEVAVAAQVAGWGTLAAASATNAARIATAWLSVLGPMGAVIAAAETINNQFGPKGGNPNNLSLIERLNPFKALHGYSFSLPGFAQGGVVPGAFGQPMPILAHGGEVVSTRGQQMRGGGSGGPQTIVVQFGTQELARFVVDAQTGAVRRGVG